MPGDFDSELEEIRRGFRKFRAGGGGGEGRGGGDSRPDWVK